MRGVAEWSDDGESFVIYDADQFSKLLPKYFKTDNFASFVRQLNMYNFQKVKGTKGCQKFSHPFFRQGRPEDLIKIQRKTANTHRQSRGISKKEQAVSGSYNLVQERLMRVEKTLKMLTMQNQILMKSNDKMMKSFTRKKTSNDLKISKLLLITCNAIKNSQRIKGRTGGIPANIKSSIGLLQEMVKEGSKQDVDFDEEDDEERGARTDQLLNNALEAIYTQSINLQPCSIPIAEKQKNQAEEKLLEEITTIVGKEIQIPQNVVEEENSESEDDISVSEEAEEVQFFDDDDQNEKKDICFDCDKLDLQNNQFTPGLLKPHMFEMTPDLRKNMQ